MDVRPLCGEDQIKQGRAGALHTNAVGVRAREPKAPAASIPLRPAQPGTQRFLLRLLLGAGRSHPAPSLYLSWSLKRSQVPEAVLRLTSCSAPDSVHCAQGAAGLAATMTGSPSSDPGWTARLSFPFSRRANRGLEELNNLPAPDVPQVAWQEFEPHLSDPSLVLSPIQSWAPWTPIHAF